MWKKTAELCGENAFDDLWLVTSAGTGNLEDYLVESGQRVAADGAALASVLALSSPQHQQIGFLLLPIIGYYCDAIIANNSD